MSNILRAFTILLFSIIATITSAHTSPSICQACNQCHYANQNTPFSHDCHQACLKCECVIAGAWLRRGKCAYVATPAKQPTTTKTTSAPVKKHRDCHACHLCMISRSAGVAGCEDECRGCRIAKSKHSHHATEVAHHHQTTQPYA